MRSGGEGAREDMTGQSGPSQHSSGHAWPGLAWPGPTIINLHKVTPLQDTSSAAFKAKRLVCLQ